MERKNREQLRAYFASHEIRLVALDLDRTTLHSDGRLAERTKEAICQVLRCGIHVAVISGRPRCSLPQDVLALEGVEYLLTSNGAAVYKRDSKTGTEARLHSWVLEAASVRRIMGFTRQEFLQGRLTYEAFVKGTAYAPEAYVMDPQAYGTPDYAVSYVQTTRTPVADFERFVRENEDSLDSLDLIIPEKDAFFDLGKKVRQEVGEIYMTSSMERMLEISHKDAGKGSGLRFLANALGCELASVIAFGDGDNDADMLACAGVGVAVANATELCLQQADYITARNDQYGVAQVLELLVSMVDM